MRLTAVRSCVYSILLCFFIAPPSLAAMQRGGSGGLGAAAPGGHRPVDSLKENFTWYPCVRRCAVCLCVDVPCCCGTCQRCWGPCLREECGVCADCLECGAMCGITCAEMTWHACVGFLQGLCGCEKKEGHRRGGGEE